MFRNYYPKLCDAIKDINSLLKYFVEENIINSEDAKEIDAISLTSDKVKKILQKIEGPLKWEDPVGFCTMLNIMEEHGVQATKKLAIGVKTNLGIQSKLTVLFI